MYKENNKDAIFMDLQERLHARPLYPSQRPEKRVLRLAAGAPSLLSVPAPNKENDNSAVVLTYQVSGSHPLINQ